MSDKYVMDSEVQLDLHELLEDTIQYWCREHELSEQLAWLITQSYTTARVEQLRGNIR